MEVKQVINGGKLTGSYVSNWGNEMQLTVDGGEINVKIPEDELRDLANRLNERIATIDKEREEERIEAKEKAAADSLAMHADD